MQPSFTAIHRFSVALSWGCIALGIGFPVVFVVFWFVAGPTEVFMANDTSLTLALLTEWQRAVAILIAAVSPVLLGVGLFHARACFLQFAQGSFFTTTTVAGLRGFAGWVCASVVAGIVAQPVLTLWITSMSGMGELKVSVGVGTNQLLLLLVAGMVWVIAAVMTHAVTLADEHAQFV